MWRSIADCPGHLRIIEGPDLHGRDLNVASTQQVAARLEAATERGELDVGEGQQLAANMRTRLGLHAQRCADLLAQAHFPSPSTC